MIELRIHVKPLDRFELSRRDKIIILRGQLTLLRQRAESDFPVSVEAIARAEELARSLELGV